MARVAGTAPFWVVAVSAAALGLAGCAGPVATYHNIEGGAIAGPLQPPPGMDEPYRNLADVPPMPAPVSAAELANVSARLAPVPAPQPGLVPNPAALAGLALPDGPPAAPVVPDIYVPPTPAPHVITYPAPPPAPPAPALPKAEGAPFSVAFEPGSAVLGAGTVDALQKFAAQRGDATVLVGGFGAPGAVADESALDLAVNRARAIADALTADGVPVTEVRMLAMAQGSGGFVQLTY